MRKVRFHQPDATMREQRVNSAFPDRETAAELRLVSRAFVVPPLASPRS